MVKISNRKRRFIDRAGMGKCCICGRYGLVLEDECYACKYNKWERYDE